MNESLKCSVQDGARWKKPAADLPEIRRPKEKKTIKKGEPIRLAFLRNLVAEWTGLEPATPGVTGRYSNQLNYHSASSCSDKAFNLRANSTELCSSVLAEWTGLEPATPGVTGRYSNQLNYHSVEAVVFSLGGELYLSFRILQGSAKKKFAISLFALRPCSPRCKKTHIA